VKRRRLLRFVGLAAWVSAALAGLAVAADNPFRLKPGAAGKLCLDCHADVEAVMALPHVHTPVESGACADCHDPHASSHGKLLAESPERICLECHDDITADGLVSSHDLVLAGNCATCHDPHGSENPSNLIRAGNDLCRECHAELAASVASAKFGHPPARDDCLSCHDPHGSTTARSLLRQLEPDLCVDCHDATGGQFRSRHLGYPVEAGRCTSCHDPHGSDQGSILWANVHRPVGNRMCDQCHGAADSQTALETKREGLDLCRGCHSELVNQTFNAGHVHWPVVDKKGCLNCHAPHASAENGLLTQPMKPLCEGCHRDIAIRAERSVAKHEPVEAGECTSCHDPHAGSSPLLLASSNTIELCGNCHDWRQHTAHPLGEDAVDTRNPNLFVDCVSCHRTHGSPHDHLASFDVKADLCVDCHETFRR
jgi:predicted CXXCH cytochrome family protein